MPDHASLIVTFISRHPPYGSDAPFACLEAALAFSVFEQRVNYCFGGDGIFQLLKQQRGDAVQSKTLSSALEALDVYGIDNVLVERDALEQRGLTEKDLCIPVRLLEAGELREIISASDVVFTL